MNFFLFIASVSLIIQLGVLALLIIGYGFKRRLRYRLHGIFMLSAVTLHLVAILTIMVPSFIAITLEKPTALITAFAPFHATAGLITTILGVWIVGGWRLRPSIQYCSPKKKFMLATLTLWLTTLTLGIIFYFILNWTLIFG
jgi:uncharacterized membrane protein YozB (DUF420 family)